MRQRGYWIAGILMIVGPTVMAWGQVAAVADAGGVPMADRLAEIAQTIVRAPTVTAPARRMSVSLLAAANKLNPAEPRHLRLLVEARLRTGDVAGAIQSLKVYRELMPDDRVAQVQYIDLVVSRMETSEQRLAYLKQVISNPKVPAEVRCHAAVLASRIYRERMQESDAAAMLTQALKFNSLSPEALRMQWETLSPAATPLERTGVMLAMIRSNPAQPAVMADLAKQLAEVGLVEKSVAWYTSAGTLYQQIGQSAPLDLAQAVACAMFLTNQNAQARNITEQLTKLEPENVDHWFLLCLIDKAVGNKEVYAATRQRTANALTNRLIAARQKAGLNGATTRPVESTGDFPLPTVGSDAKAIAAAAAEVREEYVSAAAGLAWFHIYFNQSTVLPGQLAAVLRSVLPRDDVRLARLEGWMYLLEGRNDAAKVKLSAVAERDPMAAIGLLQVADAESADRAAARRRQLVSENTSGLRAAAVWEALRDPKLKRVPSNLADAVAAELAKFPVDLLGVLERPNRFYGIRAEALQVTFAYHQPILARVTIQNLSAYDLTVGADGIIHPDLWFDAQWRGMVPQSFTGVAFERLGQAIVLRSQQSITQIVRLDQGEMARLLMANPRTPITIFASCMTNPMFAGNSVIPAPGGYRVQFLRLMERAGSALGTEAARQAVYSRIADGDVETKMNSLDLLAAYCQLLRSDTAPDSQRPLVGQFAEVIHKATGDADPTVATWASVQWCQVAPAEAVVRTVRQMAASDQWVSRLASLVVAPSLPATEQKTLAAALADDPAVLVRDYAKALQESMGMPATQPTTAPTTKAAAQTSAPTTRPAAEPATAPTTAPATRPATVPTTRP